jgi:hypothetical protein
MVLALVAGAMAVVLVSGVSVAAIAVRTATSGVQTVSLGNEDEVAGVDISAIQGGANILLVGSDERDDGSQVDAGGGRHPQRRDDPGPPLGGPHPADGCQLPP